MTAKSFYKDDVFGYVTPSNSIPWLYDLDSCCDCDVVSSLATEKDAGDGDCKVRSGSSMFSDPLDPALSKFVSQSNHLEPSAETSRADGFMRSFTESLCSSIIHDAVNARERKLSIRDGTAVSRLTTRYVRNVAVLGVAMMLCQAPFYGVRSLQSSINGLSGRWALVVYHLSVVIVMPLVSSAAVSARIRPKTAVMLSMVAGLPFTIMAAFRVSFETSILLPVIGAVAGAATSLMSEMYEIYVMSLGASCAALSDDRRAGGRVTAKHFFKVFSQYLLVMQQISLLAGNFATSAIYFMTYNFNGALSTSTSIGK